MTAAPAYEWSVEAFLRAFDAGAFESRVELVEGEIWPVSPLGDWHGRTSMRVGGLLYAWRSTGELSQATLAAGTRSLPDPDCWVSRPGAVPSGSVSGRVSRWDPADVLLVVEVSDTSLTADLTIKARLYGSAGFGVYWVVSPDRVYVHTDPTPSGYRQRVEYLPGEQVPVPYADAALAVSDLVG